jgi:hypothetical protein
MATRQQVRPSLEIASTGRHARVRLAVLLAVAMILETRLTPKIQGDAMNGCFRTCKKL